VTERIGALAGASASVVLFLEYIPQVLRAWLGGLLGRGPEAVAAACTMLERNLRAGLAFMNRNGLLPGHALPGGGHHARHSCHP
jgi:hypothetical protein